MSHEQEGRLDGLRAGIARIDESLVALLAERVALAREVGAVKRAAGLPRLDPAREAAVVRNGTELARGVGLDDEEVREILWRVVGLCRRAQEEA
jgi:chorismate mutase